MSDEQSEETTSTSSGATHLGPRRANQFKRTDGGQQLRVEQCLCEQMCQTYNSAATCNHRTSCRANSMGSNVWIDARVPLLIQIWAKWSNDVIANLFGSNGLGGASLNCCSTVLSTDDNYAHNTHISHNQHTRTPRTRWKYFNFSVSAKVSSCGNTLLSTNVTKSYINNK